MGKLTISDLIFLLTTDRESITLESSSLNLSTPAPTHLQWHQLTRQGILRNAKSVPGVYILGLRLASHIPTSPVYVGSGNNAARRLKYWDNRLKPDDKYRDNKVIGRTLMLQVPREYWYFKCFPCQQYEEIENVLIKHLPCLVNVKGRGQNGLVNAWTTAQDWISLCNKR
ncbi:hypothetical protein AM501_00695 [Aneurinibacillus migulanus]|uniref:hypothetical protein n=1 Tax=Aneurinibacillus migulanus TaxID=47500 RepID=UPI0005BD1673|nr:hypothetical protein [Aneurinibacillus migulanus]KIV59264.1 hypothetical protein TS64_02365 [Aneurinibacillus migulanus]KPD10100.1 hypothetical protein AM501_00695 [Aneurinibacillus migulanus]